MYFIEDHKKLHEKKYANDIVFSTDDVFEKTVNFFYRPGKRIFLFQSTAPFNMNT